MLLQPCAVADLIYREVMVLENLNELWQYQQMDMKLDAYKRKVQDTPTRKQLLKLKRFMQSGQNKIADAESKAAIRQNTLTELKVQSKKLMEDIEEVSKDIGYYSECDDSELDQKLVSELVRNSEKLCDAAANVRAEIARFREEIVRADKAIREILLKMRAAKEEYDQLKQKYEQELAEGSGELKQMEQQLADAGKNIPEEVLKDYHRIKTFRPDPVARLCDNRCDGCKIGLPSGVAASVANSDHLVHCENCGRILIVL